MGTTNKTDVQTDLQKVSVYTMMYQVKLLILCILRRTWGWYKAMMPSQPHHIPSDSAYNSLIYISSFVIIVFKVMYIKEKLTCLTNILLYSF